MENKLSYLSICELRSFRDELEGQSKLRTAYIDSNFNHVLVSTLIQEVQTEIDDRIKNIFINGK